MVTVAAVGLAGGDQARAAGHPVEVDGARPALALLAGVLRPGQPHPLAQDVEQALALPDVVGLPAFAVDRHGHPHQSSSPPVRRPRPSRGSGRPSPPGRAVGTPRCRGRRRSARPRTPPGGRTRRPRTGRAGRAPSQSSSPARNVLRGARPARGRRRRADAGADLPGARGAGPAPKAATAITIALRVPILLNCWGPVAGADPDRGDQLVRAPDVLLDAGVELVRPAPGVRRRAEASSTSANGGEQGRVGVAGRARRRRGCRRRCRGCGSAGTRPCARPGRGRAARRPSSSITPGVGDAGAEPDLAVDPLPGRPARGPGSGRAARAAGAGRSSAPPSRRCRP